MINSGTWQAQTGYQKNLGIMPRPGLVPIVNLATLEVHLKEFLVSSRDNKVSSS
jgi:DNA polymerase II small subunit